METSQQIAALETRVAELEALLAVKEPDKSPPAAYPDGIERDGQGNVIVSPEHDGHDAYCKRMKAQAESERVAENEQWERRTEGLPTGQWRDPCGLIRDRDGQLFRDTDRKL